MRSAGAMFFGQSMASVCTVHVTTVGPSSKKKGATKHCAYGKCRSDSRYAEREDMQDVFFVRFPQMKKNPEKCIRWSKACCRENFSEMNITKDTYICCLHFVGGKGPTDEHPDPIPATATKYDVARLSKKPRRDVRRRLAMSMTNTPSPNVPAQRKRPVDVIHDESQEEVANILISLHDSLPTINASNNLSEHEQDKENCDEYTEHRNKIQCCGDIRNSPERNEVETQTPVRLTLDVKESLSLRMDNYRLQQELDKVHQSVNLFSLEEVQDDENKMHFYTGLTFAQFLCLWNFLGPAANSLSRVNQPRKYEGTPSKSRGPKRKLSPQNELFLTLIRLRLGLLHKDLAYRFNISIATVNDIITTWIQFLYLQFDRLRPLMFASRKKTRKHLPRCFKNYKNVRVILDATEFFTQAPRNYEQQGNMYSNYKNHCTCKVLIGITLSGAISFVSNVYEGCISDKEILKRSGILEQLNPGDLVMVDRGFNVRDLLLTKGADIVIPPFLGGRKSLTAQEEVQTRTIAKLRIHVERAIERMKKFKILKKLFR